VVCYYFCVAHGSFSPFGKAPLVWRGWAKSLN